MNGLVKFAVGITPIQHIVAFWRLVIALLVLSADWISAQCDFVGTDHFALANELEDSFFLQDDDVIDVRFQCWSLLRGAKQTSRDQTSKVQYASSEYSDAHRRDYRRDKFRECYAV